MGAACRLLAISYLLAAAAFGAAANPRSNILVCMADDWTRPHSSVYGDRVARTPTFERVAREGMFTHVFSAAPSCTGSRAGFLTGQAVHRLGEGANLRVIWRKEIDTCPDLLETAGYAVGRSGTGWGPRNLEGSGRTPRGKADLYDAGTWQPLGIRLARNCLTWPPTAAHELTLPGAKTKKRRGKDCARISAAE
jgi:Sulfatase